MKVFLDFDNTLLHTRKLVNTLYKPYLESQGIPLEKIESTFSTFASGVDPAKEAFSIEKHLAKLAVEKEKESECLRVSHDLFRRAKEFLFPDAVSFLQNLSPYEAILLTYGDSEFQTLKIEASGIGSFVSEICITEGSKLEEMVKHVDEEEVFAFVDDHGEYFASLKKKFGKRIYGYHFLHPDTQKTCKGCSADAHPKSFESIIHSLQTLCAA